MTSPDGASWTIARLRRRTLDIGGLGARARALLRRGLLGTGNRVMTSPDGDHLDAPRLGRGQQLDLGGLVARARPLRAPWRIRGTGNRVMTSPDGVPGRLPRLGRRQQLDLGDLVAGTGPLLPRSRILGNDRVMTSPDGVAWTARPAAAQNDWRERQVGARAAASSPRWRALGHRQPRHDQRLRAELSLPEVAARGILPRGPGRSGMGARRAAGFPPADRPSGLPFPGIPCHAQRESAAILAAGPRGSQLGSEDRIRPRQAGPVRSVAAGRSGPIGGGSWPGAPAAGSRSAAGSSRWCCSGCCPSRRARRSITSPAEPQIAQLMIGRFGASYVPADIAPELFPWSTVPVARSISAGPWTRSPGRSRA